MTEKATTAAEKKAADERDTGLRAAYQAATKTLRTQYQDEFNGLYQMEAAARGIDWSPRKTKEEKDRDELARILADHPHLAAEISPEILMGQIEDETS